MGFLLGAGHGLEIAFVFFDFDQFLAPAFAPMIYTPENDKFIIFDTSADAGIRMSSDAITLEGLYADLLAETGFTTREQHCGMYVWLFGGTALWDDTDYLNLGAEGCSAYPVD